jgi:hypothetical protein
MRWYLNPLQLRDLGRDVCRIGGGGGPRSLRVNGVGKPAGWLLPTSRVELEVVAGDGSIASFAPELPVPLPLAYAYRLARALDAPLVGTIDPERLDLELGL